MPRHQVNLAATNARAHCSRVIDRACIHQPIRAIQIDDQRPHGNPPMSVHVAKRDTRFHGHGPPTPRDTETTQAKQPGGQHRVDTNIDPAHLPNENYLLTVKYSKHQ